MGEKYKKIEILGKGATAEVYLVKEQATGEQFAMKCCSNRTLLKKEADFLNRLQHPMFPYVKEYPVQDKEYLVMEYIEGSNLQELLDRGKAFGLGEICYIMNELLQGLHYLHMQKPEMVYRDLKPANIIIDKRGKLHLIDFGAACYGGVRDELVCRAGTYGYAAPEQFWQGIKPDKACDIYAAGKLLAYLLSGKNPAEPPYDIEQFCKGIKTVPVPFLEIIERCLAVEPLARYEDCECLRRDIHRAYEATMSKKHLKNPRKGSYTYKKCIWKSEYRRIF
ncbi:MAG: serine/threonine protein kinase [Lachnospiraceae bacterium]|nr:serine/threonine protein kinase [Lachnospiraceae bacterium]